MQLVLLEPSFTLGHGAVELGADPTVNAAHRKHLQEVRTPQMGLSANGHAYDHVTSGARTSSSGTTGAVMSANTPRVNLTVCHILLQKCLQLST